MRAYNQLGTEYLSSLFFLMVEAFFENEIWVDFDKVNPVILL